MDKMASVDHFETEIWGCRPIPDLREVPLGVLFGQGRADDGRTQEIVDRMIDVEDGRPPVSPTLFNSAI
jgi:hypothetical protein